MHSSSEEEERKWWDGSQAHGQSPYPLELVHAKDPQENKRNKCRNNETDIDARVCGEDKESLLLSLFDVLLFGVFSCGHTTAWVFSTNANSDEESVSNESCKETTHGTTCSPSSRCENREQDENSGADQHTPTSSNEVSDESKEEHADDGAYESHRREEGGELTDVARCSVGVDVLG